ncbi:PREDICTED: transcription factor JUNGBRUNNEN 1-like [Ipomoea nil]|uniref:transcription factor JUNGBRUNNEN 1-like n=1 Tax=Ipomoea nil TaxID=35883 RepID=UPI0009008660|nr:PREDICTED: transcription factor JUNGBRUNNEN 1-like [Ipomoea nil]
MASCSGNKLPNGYGDEYEWKRSLPPGHGFYPTDQELITKYLKYRAQNLKIHPGIINDLDIYNHHPKELEGAYGLNEWNGRMYFFTAFKRKTKEGKRGDRAVGGGKGFWKASQAREKVKDDEGVVIGTKQPLVFHDGKGTKTSWLMSEFRYPENFNPLPLYNQTEHELALCVIYYHGERNIIGNNQESKSNNTNPMKRNIICNNQESKSNNTNPMKRNIICNNQESKSNNTNPMKRNIIGNNQEYKSNNTNPMKNLQSSHLIPTPCPNPNFTTTSNLQNPNHPPYPTLNPNFNATFARQSPNHLPSPAQNSNFIATSSLYPTQNPNFSATFTMQNPNHPPSPTQNPNFIATTSSMQNPNHSLSFAQNPNFIVASSLPKLPSLTTFNPKP